MQTVEHQVHAHSYQHELEMFYYTLKYAEEMPEHPHVIVQYMDCKGGLTKFEKEIHKPSHTMSNEHRHVSRTRLQKADKGFKTQ